MAGRRRGQIVNKGQNKWLIRVPRVGPDGKARPWNRTVHGTKKDAERALTDALKALDEGRLEDPSRVPLAAWLEEWLDNKRRDLKRGSLENYSDVLRLYICPTLGGIRLADLKPLDIQRTITALAEGRDRPGPVGPATIRQAVSRLSDALEAARKLRLIPMNPARDVTLPKAPRSGPKVVLTEEQAARLVAVMAGHRLGAMWTLALGTGLRPGEDLALRWEDVDFNQGLLHVRHSLWRSRQRGSLPELVDPKTESSKRTVPLSPGLLALLRKHRSRQAQERLAAGPAWQDNGFLFPLADGRPTPAEHARYQFYQVIRKAGLPRMSPHGLRHSAATLLIQAGIDPRTVADQLGHSSVKTTLEWYVKVTPERLREAAGVLSSIIMKADGTGS